MNKKCLARLFFLFNHLTDQTVDIRKGILFAVWLFANIIVAIMRPAYYFFPMFLGYTAWGLTRSVIHGLLERLPDRDPLADSFDDGDAEVRPVDYGELAPRAFHRPVTPIHPDDVESET